MANTAPRSAETLTQECMSRLVFCTADNAIPVLLGYFKQAMESGARLGIEAAASNLSGFAAQYRHADAGRHYKACAERVAALQPRDVMESK